MDSGKHLILIVDDDPDLRDALTRILEREGYGVLAADSAEDGLRQFKSGQPDLVMVDLMMEEVDAGTNLVRELKLLGSDVPVFMLSSVGDALHGTVSVADLGLSGVFQKPLDRKVLLSAIEARLG